MPKRGGGGAACIGMRLHADSWIMRQHIRMRRHAHVDRPTRPIPGRLQSLLVGRLLLLQPADPLGLGQGPRCYMARQTLLCALMALPRLNLQLILVLLHIFPQEPLERPVGA